MNSRLFFNEPLQKQSQSTLILLLFRSIQVFKATSLRYLELPHGPVLVAAQRQLFKANDARR